jgi:hypothetical protein
LVGKPDGKREVGRCGHRWEYNIRMNLRENRMGSCGLDFSGLGWGPVVGFCEHSNDPSGSIKGAQFL